MWAYQQGSFSDAFGLNCTDTRASCLCLSPLHLLSQLRGLSEPTQSPALLGQGSTDRACSPSFISVMCYEAAYRNRDLRIKWTCTYRAA